MEQINHIANTTIQGTSHHPNPVSSVSFNFYFIHYTQQAWKVGGLYTLAIFDTVKFKSFIIAFSQAKNNKSKG